MGWRTLRQVERRLFAAVFLALGSGLAIPLPARAAEITLNFQHADIRAVTAAISAITHKDFILDPRVQGRVTVISRTPIRASAVYAVFLSVLQVHGLAAVPAGAMIKIVPALEARQMPGPVFTAHTPGDALVTDVVPVKNVSAAQLVPLLRPLMSNEAQLASDPSAHILILSDRAANVQRILALLHTLDQAGPNHVRIVHLRHASAGAVAQTLTALFPSQGGYGGIPFQVIADPATHSLLITGAPARQKQVLALIAKLDAPATVRTTQVVYLRYAKAQTLVTELQGIVHRLAPGPSGSPLGATGGAGTEPVGILADARTNALLLTAPPGEMLSIDKLIAKLDVRPAQVLVQAIEAELTGDNSAQLGITWLAEHGFVAGTDFSTGPSLLSVAQGGTGSSTGTPGFSGVSVPQGLTVIGGHYRAGGFGYAALLNALAGTAHTSILSTPSVVTLNNTPATIEVAEQVPFITGQYTNTAGVGATGASVINPFQTVQRQSVGLTLKITPQITAGGTVLLKIKQTISNLTGSSVGGQPVTETRVIQTLVQVKSGEILVLGGLMDHHLIENEQRVPFLGRLPFLGILFRSRSTTDTQSNLMLFLQPTVLNGPALAESETARLYDRLRRLELQHPGVALMGGAKAPVLPAWPKTAARPGSAKPASIAPAAGRRSAAKRKYPFPASPAKSQAAAESPIGPAARTRRTGGAV